MPTVETTISLRSKNRASPKLVSHTRSCGRTGPKPFSSEVKLETLGFLELPVCTKPLFGCHPNAPPSTQTQGYTETQGFWGNPGCVATEQAVIVYSPFNVFHTGERDSIPHQRVTIPFVSSGLLHLLHPHADLHNPDRIVLTYWPMSLN